MQTPILNSSGTRYVILGAARSGLAAAELLLSRGKNVLLLDEKPASALGGIMHDLCRLQIPVLFGPINPDKPPLDPGDVLVLSPGVPLTAPLVRAALRIGIPVTGELELASRFTRLPMAAITGTNGKSTTTCLLAEMLTAGGKRSLASGNVGYALSGAVLQAAEEGWRSLVVEVSSFQLETIQTFRPRVAVILNLTPDHLSRHGSMENYRDIKFRISENQTGGDTLILNADDPWLAPLARKSRARVLWFCLRGPVDQGAWLEGDHLWMSLEHKKHLLERKDIPIPGLHNVQNILAAALAAAAFEIPETVIADTVRKFRGVEHRIEYAAALEGVDFYNDSKATNLDSVEKALESFSRPIVLIAGGRDKGEDYNRLNSLVGKRVRRLIVMGESAALIEKAWGSCVPWEHVDNMGEAVRTAFSRARPGDVVLLSPGCSSFDMFQDFEERGRVFKAEVMKIVGNGSGLSEGVKERGI